MALWVVLLLLLLPLLASGSQHAFLRPPLQNPAARRPAPPSSPASPQASTMTYTAEDQNGLKALLEEAVALMSADPKAALAEGRWVKLICGASYQDLPRVQALCLAYTLAGVDCIDMSASEAVVTAAEEGVNAAMVLAEQLLGRPLPRRPWLMVSVNDQDDLHFRKASFDPARCPTDCPRPCESICPTQAIPSLDKLMMLAAGGEEGVAHQDRCYGCGRCLTVCPLGLIIAKPYQVEAAEVLTSLAGRVDALEIHTNLSSLSAVDGHDPFDDLCKRIQAPASTLQAISVSFPFMGELGTTAFLQSRNGIFDRYFSGIEEQKEEGVGGDEVSSTSSSSSGKSKLLHIWQTDGRPMSGDIGKGTTLSAVKFGEVMLRSRALDWASPRQGEQQQHFLQLAGGTNAYTTEKLAAEGLLSPALVLGKMEGEGKEESQWVHGLAFGGFARMEVDRVMTEWGLGSEASLLEAPPQALVAVVKAALGVVRPVKERIK